MIAVGGNEIGKIYVGSTEISRAYVGNSLVYDNSGSTPSLPYDAKVEYLKSSGTQYIDTGINGRSVISLDITLSLDASVTTSYECFFGLWPTTSSGNGMQLLWAAGSKLQKAEGRNKFSVSGITTGTALTIGEKYTFSVTQTATTSINNTFYVFARNYGNVANTSTNKTLIYALKIYQGGVTVRDFIPVRVGQVGYMYDNVSGELFGNNGSGNFIYGNDVTT